MKCKLFVSFFVLVTLSFVFVEAQEECKEHDDCKDGCCFKNQCSKMSKTCCSSLTCPDYCSVDKCSLPEPTDSSPPACPIPFCKTPCETVKCSKDTVCTIQLSTEGIWQGASCLDPNKPCEAFPCTDNATRCYFNCFSPPCADKPYTIQCVDVDPCRYIVCDYGSYCDFPKQKCAKFFACEPVKGECRENYTLTVG